MMVPKMQGELIDIVCDASPGTMRIWDPFVGSGTILVESMIRGLDFTGCDINPLAILACMAKSGNYHGKSLHAYARRLKRRILEDRGRSYAVSFAGRAKWFSPSATIQLSKIRRGIERIGNADVRRLFWVIMAETIRRCSNSRTSTYKLHIRDDTGATPDDVTATFFALIDECCIHLDEHTALVESRCQMSRTTSRAAVELYIEDVRCYSPKSVDQCFDLVVTSPPYGDNMSTVPYGQFSYLPLQWIAPDDFPDHMLEKVFSSTHGLDTASLGGSKIAAIERGEALTSLSKSFERCFNQVRKRNLGNAKKLGAFCYDFCESMMSIAASTTPSGLSIWTVGNRTISGLEVPFARIIEEIIEAMNGRVVTTFTRTIPHKRMAVRNDTSNTMRQETVMITRFNSRARAVQ
jgi:hypothetical protein